MIFKIPTEAQYNEAMKLIEFYISKATTLGGFNKLSESETDERKRISVLAEKYEDEVLKIIPNIQK